MDLTRATAHSCHGRALKSQYRFQCRSSRARDFGRNDTSIETGKVGRSNSLFHLVFNVLLSGAVRYPKPDPGPSHQVRSVPRLSSWRRVVCFNSRSGFRSIWEDAAFRGQLQLHPGLVLLRREIDFDMIRAEFSADLFGWCGSETRVSCCSSSMLGSLQPCLFGLRLFSGLLSGLKAKMPRIIGSEK